jgi:release factor glutamine methyltransferase
MPRHLRTTIKHALAKVVSQLKQLSDPQLDAQWLLLKVMAKDEISWLLTHSEECLTKQQEQTLAEYVTRRGNGEPLAYILGEWEFYGRPFLVNKDVLIPRPSTERLVEEALIYCRKTIEQNTKKYNVEGWTIADIGTGSGCVAITLGLEIDEWLKKAGLAIDWKIIATDVSKEALDVAKQNAVRYNLANRVEFILGDLLHPIRDKKIDLIVSNPPYVPAAELRLSETGGNEKIGLRFEPRVALDGGSDGLETVNQLLQTKIPLIYESVRGEILTNNNA